MHLDVTFSAPRNQAKLEFNGRLDILDSDPESPWLAGQESQEVVSEYLRR
jgi:hypothetical protein